MPEATTFQFKADKQTGLSAVYDTAKMNLDEIPFDFRNYKLTFLDNVSADYEYELNEIVVKQNKGGFECYFFDTDGNAAPVTVLALGKLKLPADFKLNQESFEQKPTEKGAKTLKENILLQLSALDLAILPFNVKFYKVTPSDPKQKSFLLALNHAKSGSAPKDASARAIQRKEINRFSKQVQANHPECTHLVIGGDFNEPAYQLKDGIEAAQNDADLQVNIKGLSKESQELAGDNLVLTDVALPAFIIDKARIVGCRTNAQTDKGGEKGNDRLSAKGRVMVFKFQMSDESNKNANAEATQKILEAQGVPKGEVRALHSGKTFGSDHGQTQVVKVNGIHLDTRPLLETAGPRGFHSYEGLYKKPYDDESIKIEQDSALKLTELILIAMGGRSLEDIRNMPFKEREKAIHPKAGTLSPLLDAFFSWDKKEPKPELYAVLKDWIESDEQRATNDLLAKQPELETEEDILKIFKEFSSKTDRRILDAIFRAEKIELSAGFTYLPNPRVSQLASYDDMSGKVDIRIAAGDGPKNHDKYAEDMLKVCTRLNELAARPKRLSALELAGYTALGFIFGACVGTAFAVAIGFMAPVVLGVALGAAALLGVLTLGYVLYRQPAEQVHPKIATVSEMKSAPAQTVEGAKPEQKPVAKPAITFSHKRKSASESNEAEVVEPIRKALKVA